VHWARQRGIIEVSPCLDIERPAPEHSRDRVLSDEEVRAVWHACEALGSPFGALIRLLILTGQRRGEVGEMRWSEVDLAGKMWVLPKERCKNKKAHSVPLSRLAVEIFESLPRIYAAQDFVFTITGSAPVTGFARAKERLDAMLPDMAAWTLHDLRRSFASGCARLGIAVHVVEAALNHRGGAIKGVAAVYNRYSYDAEKRRCVEAWASHIEWLASGDFVDNNIIPMHGGLAERTG
jgi:integrase